MGVETDKYIVASFAIWAGDFVYFEKLLSEFSPPHKIKRKIHEQVQDPIEIIRWAGAKRLRQLRQKKGEFRNIVAEYKKLGFDLSDRPLILETMNLRSTLWRIGERDFLLQGYLKDFKWQKELFIRARKIARIAEHTEPEVKGKPFMPLGARWVMPGNLFLKVELTDLGLLEAEGVWTGRRLPKSAKPITSQFSKLLDLLDERIEDSKDQRS